MKLYWLFLCCMLFAQKAHSTQITTPFAIRYGHLTADSINKLNNRANNIYLANPVYARELASTALLGSKIINYQKGIGYSSFIIGITYWAQSYYPISLLYIDTALRYMKKYDPKMVSICYRYIGRNYTDLKDYSSSAIYLDRALKTAGTDQEETENILSEQSYLYLKLKQYDKAFNSVNQSLHYCNALKDTGTKAILYSRLTTIYLAKKDLNKALSYSDSTIKMSYLVNNRRLRAGAYVAQSLILFAQHNNTIALKFAQQGLALGDSLGVMDAVDRAYNALINIYTATHNTKQLVYYQNQYNAFLNNRLTLNRQNNSQLMRDHFELNEKLQDINLINQAAQEDSLRIKMQQQIITVLIISMLLLITALYIVWFYFKQKTAIAQKLREQYIATLAQSKIIKNQAHDLEELNNFKSKLLAIIGHDLRTPINNLRNVTDMFADGSFTADEVHLLMKNINPLVKGAELTLSNLLVWADGQIRGIKTIQTEPVNLLNVIEETEEICKSSLDKKHINIRHNTKANCTALVDENHIKVIFSNLISNAIKFTNKNGNIIIDVDHDDDKIVVSVTDTGIGMSTEEIEKVLSVNIHFSKPGTQGETGTGIGLLLCRELIEINGGKLWVNSSPGKGTTFYFSLPSANLKVA